MAWNNIDSYVYVHSTYINHCSVYKKIKLFVLCHKYIHINTETFSEINRFLIDLNSN